MARAMVAEPDEIVVGVDTHADVHVAVAITAIGTSAGSKAVATTEAGFAQLVVWGESLGTVRCFGVEGAGSYGASLARHLKKVGHAVVEVDRPERRMRHLKGKSDTIDAEAAARAVLSGRATGVPKSADGRVEMIRALRLTRRSAVKARTQAANQLVALVLTAPELLRARLRGLSMPRLVDAAARFRIGALEDPESAMKKALRSLARRYLVLSEEVDELDRDLDELVRKAAPELLLLTGVGTDVAGALLVAAGDNPADPRQEDREEDGHDGRGSGTRDSDGRGAVNRPGGGAIGRGSRPGREGLP
jgi:transposase